MKTVILCKSNFVYKKHGKQRITQWEKINLVQRCYESPDARVIAFRSSISPSNAAMSRDRSSVEGEVYTRCKKNHVQISKTVAKVQKIIMKMAFPYELFQLFKFHEDLLHEKQKKSIVEMLRLLDFFQISLKTWRHFAKKTFIFVHFFPFFIVNSRGKIKTLESRYHQWIPD